MSDVKISIPEDEETSKTKNVEKQPNKQERKFFKTVSTHCSEFLGNSSIHGFRYLTGTERSIVEKFWWICIISISVYICGLLIKSTWQKWEDTPVFISISQKSVPLENIPFPAVTICPGYQYNKKSNLVFPLYSSKKSAANVPFGSTNVSILCDEYVTGVTDYEREGFVLEPDISTFFEETGFSVKDVFLFCWSEFGVLCKALFSPIFTDMGVCFSFNMLSKYDIFNDDIYLPSTHFDNRNISNWTPDENYHNITAKDSYPFRSMNTFSDIIFLLKPLSEIGCRGYDGFKIILHHPAEFPTSSKSSIYIGSIDSYFIWIKPEITLTCKDLESHSFRRRKCYYSNERRLRFFKFYTMEFCKLECLTNYTLKLCGCVPYYFPHNRTTKICGSSRPVCFPSLSGDDWSVSQTKLRIQGFNSQTCDCLPTCTSIKYTSELVKKPTKAFPLHWGSEVVIKFRDEEFMAMERQELFGDVNFWANCGGLLGLFTGFSFISLAEIVYYLIFRWIFVLGRRLWYRLSGN